MNNSSPPPSSLLDGLAPDYLHTLALQGQVRHYRKNTLLIQEGDVGAQLYVVLHGNLREFAISQDSKPREITLAMAGRGDVLGLLALEGGQHCSSVITLGPAVCAVVSAESVKVNEIAAQANAIKIDAQADLDEALPAFEGAVKALKALSKNDITEIKSFAKPPPLVQTVLEAVCILKGAKPTWDDAKKIMSDSSFLSSLETYDKDNIPPKVLKAIQTYIANPDFTPDNVEKVSKAAKSLCTHPHAKGFGRF